jgi:hypothetical protein
MTTSLCIAAPIWSVTSGAPWLIRAAAVAYAEKAFVNSSSSAPRNAGARIGPPTWRQNDHERRRGWPTRRTTPGACHRARQEDDQHQRDLEVRVDDREPVRLYSHEASDRMSMWRRPEQERDEAVEAERRQEGEREHHAAELGEHARGGDDELAEEPVRVAADDGPASMPPMIAPAIAVATASWIERTKAST